MQVKMWSVAIISNTRLHVKFTCKTGREYNMLFVMRIPSFIQVDMKENRLLTDVMPVQHGFVNISDEFLIDMVSIKNGERYGNIAVHNNRILNIPVSIFTEFTPVETTKKTVLVHTNNNSITCSDSIVTLNLED